MGNPRRSEVYTRGMSDFNRVVAMNTLAGVGMGMVGIFIPIYLLELKYSLSTVVTWLLIHHVSLLVSAFLVVWVAKHVGLVPCWYVRIVLVGGLFAGLFVLPTYAWFLFPLAVLSGLESAFFWIPYNIFTVRKTERASMGASLAFMQNVGSAVGILIPGIAALIIVNYGYGLLFAVAAFFIYISLIPVLILRKEKADFAFSFSAIKEVALKNKQFIFPEIFDNLSQDAQVIWTLYIFIAALTILDIGLLSVLVGVIGMVVTYLTGRLVDRWDTKFVVRFGAVFATLLWVASWLVALYDPSPFMLYAITALRGFAVGIFATSYATLMFNRARSADAQFLVLREIPTIFGRVVLFLATLFFISIGQVELTFLLVAALSLYFWFNNLKKLSEKA